MPRKPVPAQDPPRTDRGWCISGQHYFDWPGAWEGANTVLHCFVDCPGPGAPEAATGSDGGED